MSTLGERLKLARERTGLKQTQVKERTNINNKTLSGYENNVSEPDAATLAILADLYGVSYKWLLTGEGSMINESNKLTDKDSKDIAKRLQKFREEIENSDGLAFNGEPLSEEAKESLIESMEYIFRQTQKINKKYVPKKYREEDNE
ncbi:helix-turn-helix domain-containing protein [Ureibacillus thermosphaericus]|uniref:Transcriptional regulator with XRE-family HTH domain n=1 Tax=Ureibacillus thermosphaericus TaxID=51173 RepID=A0A840PQX3_URETH|nr:helix-turn-helix transcriptional regulator [Ureibacillus thermosphaericus]MBB5148217.1 transcriptional regulator with XRE-family HTH domain [Ureibacillus thermosphaericus]NKZ31125.1 helix-turn-helix transcriptional regulator [Ureibacillus thermosphaericus]